MVALETAGGQVVHGMAYGRAPGAEPTFSVRTVHLALTAAEPPAGPNVWPVAVRRCIFQGDFTQVHVGWGERELVVRCAGLVPLAEGAEAFLSVSPEHCVLLEGESSAR